MRLLRSIDRNVKVLKRNPNIRWTCLRILRWRREGHLILLKVEESSEPGVGQDEDGQKYLDEGAQRVLLFLEPPYYMRRVQGQFAGAGRPANRASIHVI